MVEKVPEFSAESLCLHQGMVTSGNGHYLPLVNWPPRSPATAENLETFSTIICV